MRRKTDINLPLTTFLCGFIAVILVVGWTYTYNITTPAGSDDPKEADDRMREIKAAIQERMNVHHYWPLTANEVNDVNTGQQRNIEFYGPISKPTAATNKGWLYEKDVSSTVEFFWLDEADNELQITSGGYLYGTSLDPNGVNDSKIRLRNNQPLIALDAAGTGTVDLIKAGTDGNSVLPDGARMDTSAAPDVNEGITNKKYVDDQNALKDGISPLVYAGEESVTFPNGLIVKMGYKETTSTSATVTFATPFTGITTVVIVDRGTQMTYSAYIISAQSKTGFTAIIDAATYKTGFNWIAIGY